MYLYYMILTLNYFKNFGYKQLVFSVYKTKNLKVWSFWTFLVSPQQYYVLLISFDIF